MPQDRHSGAAAAEWGLTTARIVGETLGIKFTSQTSNAGTFQGRRIVLKTARKQNNSVGVTYRMLPQIDEVLGAWETSPGKFEIWALPVEAFRQHTRDNRSRRGTGKVGLVTRKVFRELGRRIPFRTIGRLKEETEASFQENKDSFVKQQMEAPALSATLRRQAGHYEVLGETYAKFEFFENGWNPYSRFLDMDKVDFILRRRDQNRPTYREVQVKYGKLYPCTQKWELPLFDITSWRFFWSHEFDAYLDHHNFFVAYVLAEDIGYRGDIFIFPVKVFAQLLQVAIPSGDKKKVYISRLRENPKRWVLRKVNKFAVVNESTTMDVSRFRRNFGALL